MKKFFVIVLILVSFLILIQPAFADDGHLQFALQSHTLSDFSKLTLKDVLDENKTSPALLNEYGSVTIVPQGLAEVTAADVFNALANAGAPLSKISLSSSSALFTKASPKIVVLQKVKLAIAQKVADMNQIDASELKVDFVQVPEELPEEGSFSKIEVNTEPPMYKISFYNQSSQLLSKAVFQVKVSYQSVVLLTKRNIQAGEMFSEEDVYSQQHLVEFSPDIVKNVSELKGSGWQFSQNVNAGEVLKKSVFQRTTLLQKGALVNMIKKEDHFQVQTLGRVKEVMNGGTSVLVENLDSKKEVLAKPISPNEVEVVY